MLRVTDDILELRCWAEARGARPCRASRDGHLLLVFGEGAGGAAEVEWGEFEPAFCASHSVFIWDDHPGSRLCFVGSEAEARAWFQAEIRIGAAAPAIPG